MTVYVPVWDHSDDVKAFVEHGLWQGRRQFDDCVGIGFATADRGLVAGIIYHNYQPDENTIEISAYAHRCNWMTRKNLQLIFEYPFEQLGARLVVSRTHEHNRPVRRIWQRLGSLEYIIPDLRGEGIAEAINILKRSVWNTSRFRRIPHV